MELGKYRKNLYSQYGEDGIIAKIFDILDIKSGYVCEFGAWDGIHLSNTYNLYAKNPDVPEESSFMRWQREWPRPHHDSNFTPILIESDIDKFNDLKKNLSYLNKKYIANKFINKDSNHKDSLYNIIKKFNIKDLNNKNFVLLSIDVDGPDYEIWEGFTDYTPPIVIIEASKLLHPEEEIYPCKDGGASAGILVKLGKEKGYELICHTGVNLVFVKKELFPKFQITDNSIKALYIYTQGPAILKKVELGHLTKEEGERTFQIMADTPGYVIQFCEGFVPGNPWQ